MQWVARSLLSRASTDPVRFMCSSFGHFSGFCRLDCTCTGHQQATTFRYSPSLGKGLADPSNAGYITGHIYLKLLEMGPEFTR